MSIEQAEARFSRDPFAKFLGMNLVDIAHERAVVTLPYQPEHANAAGPLNGGASASLLNVAGKVAAWTGIDLDQKPYLACVDMTVQYLSAAIEEDAIAEAKVLRRGRDLFFLDVALRSPDGRPICQGLISYRSPDYTGHTPRLLPRHVPHPEISHTLTTDDAWLIQGYVEKLAIICQHYSPGRVQMHMPGRKALMDARGQLHDGVLASVIDVCGTAVAWSLVPAPQRRPRLHDRHADQLHPRGSRGGGRRRICTATLRGDFFQYRLCHHRDLRAIAGHGAGELPFGRAALA